jgi:hypothetical protein
MEDEMKLFAKTVTFTMFSILLVGVAQAGYKFSAPVRISSANAYGNMAAARGSSDSKQYIGCDATVDSEGGVMVGCQARDSNGNTASCSSTNAAFLPVVQMVNGDSFVSFDWDSHGFCTEIHVDNHSYYAPKGS